MKEEFYISDFEEEVIKELKKEGYHRSNISMARSTLEKISNTVEKPLNPANPQLMRERIFRFYENQNDYDQIKNMHIMPTKKILQKAAENTEDISLKRNIEMVEETLKKGRFTNAEDIIEDLDEKILEKREKEKLPEKFEGAKKFALKLCLGVPAKIGALAAIKHEDFDEKQNDITLKNQYQQDGEKELGRTRRRLIEIDDELSQIYKEEIKPNDTEYLFGDNVKESYNNLRILLEEVNKEHNRSKITSSVLRDTSGYFKSSKMDSDDLRREMGLKTDIKVQRFRKVRELRED